MAQTINCDGVQIADICFMGAQADAGNSNNFSVGDSWTYDDAASNIDVTVEIVAKSANGSLTTIDNNDFGNECNFQPQFSSPMPPNNQSATEFVQFEICFVDGTTQAPVTIPILNLVNNDIDGDNCRVREFVSYVDPTSYTVNNNNNITVTGNVKAEATTTQQQAGIGFSNDYSISLQYQNVSCYLYSIGIEIDVRPAGTNCTGNGARLSTVATECQNFDDPVIVEITCPDDQTVTCENDIIVSVDNATTIANCSNGSSISISGPVVNGTADCPGTTYTYTYTLQDNCGNQVSCDQIFTIAPNPINLTCPSDMTVSCLADISPGLASATSNCGILPVVAMTLPELISGDPNCNGSIYEITYTATDICGAMVSCTQAFTLENGAPTISCPANMTVTCLSDIDPSPEDAMAGTSCALGSSIELVGPTVSGTPNCPGTTYTYTYTVTDDCGRTASCQQVFTIENTAPTITCPADATVACFADINVSNTDATITSSCMLGANVVLTGPLISGDVDCPNTTYTYTYTVTDDCGRSDSCQRVFTIQNNSPTISCPAGATVACFENISVDAVNAITTSSCSLDSNVDLTGPVISGNPDCPNTTYTYTYTVTDDCGRTAACQQVFTIANDGPTISCPADQTVECFADISVSNTDASTTSSCSIGTNVILTGPVISGDADCPNTTYTYTYTVTDDCGRSDSCQSVFTIQNDAPTITCPADQTVGCSSEITAGTATTTLSCGLGVDVVPVGPVLISGLPDDNGSIYQITYTVTDDCDRTASCVQSFTINNVNPSITCPADAVVDCAADIVIDANDAMSSASCELTTTNTVSGPVIDGSPDCPNTTYTYTYTVTDQTGRTATCEQVFTIANDGPTISCPADQTVECFADIVAANTNATAVTSCMLGSTIALTGPVISGDADCPNTSYTYTNTVTDDCGRTAACEQVFTIANDPPTISCPADQTVDCFADIVVAITNATATTSCSLGAPIVLTGPVIVGDADCPNTTYTYTYTATDDCGRTASCEQVFTIANDPPTISCPADQTVDCFADIVVANTNATAFTSCTLGSTIVLSGPVISGDADCPNTSYTYTYTVTDDCGRTAACQQVFTITNDGPTITCPANQTVECFADIVVANSNATAVTSCMLGSTIALTGPVISGDADCPNTTYTYTYTVTDDCNRTASCTQVFTIQNDAPTITCPADQTVGCSSEITAGTATTTMSCGLGVSVMPVGPTLVSGLPDDNGSIYQITYTVTDDCGRSASCVQSFTIDNVNPSITCPADAVVDCAADIVIDANDAMSSASCDLTTTNTVSGPVIDGSPDCPNTTYTYTYTATDQTGRTATCEQVFTIANDGPIISCPADQTVECFLDIVVVNTNATATTSCMLGSTIVLTGPVVAGDADCPNTSYTYTYTVTDDCGRTAACQQVFTIANDGPTISCPADQTVECFADIVVANTNATAVTSCMLGSTIALTGPVISGDADCPNSSYTYTYTVTDDCGRTASCSQVFTIQNADPTITCPAGATVSCFANISVDAANAITTASCSLSSTVELTGPVISGDSDCPNTTYTYTYTVTDDCGRTASCTQVFTIQNDAPTITCPADSTVDCFADISVSNTDASTTSSCSLGTNVVLTGPVISGDEDCPNTTYTYTYTVTDDCNRTASCTQVFTIQNDAPTITCPADQTVGCSSEITAGTATTTMSCGLGVNIMPVGPTLVSGLPDDNGSIYQITYTVTDDCGRSASCVQSFTIDNVNPSITCPADAVVACAADIVVDADDAMSSASCDLTTTNTVSGPVIDGSPDCPNTTYTYTYTVTDQTGRTATCEQVFTIANDGPIISCPADQTVECFVDVVVVNTNATATTSCTLGSTIVLTGPVVAGDADCPNTSYTYTYTVTDDCGRTAACQQVFTIANDGPTISCPADQTVECFADIVVANTNATAVTSCMLGSTIALTGPVISGDADCPNTSYTYTYTVTDDCGRTASCSQVFTIQNADPTITCLAGATVSCFANISVDAANAITTASCSLSSTVELTGPVISGDSDCPNTTYTYTYTVTDDCGRTASCTQVFTIQNDAPTITCPADSTVDCFADISVSNTDASTTSSCSLGTNVVLTGPVISGDEDCPNTTYTYTYSVTDDCGRSDSCIRVFMIQNDAPTITCPTDQTVGCSSEISVGTATTTMSCGLGVNVVTVGPVLIGGLPDDNGSIYHITYTVTDDCDRTASCVQSFTIDNVNPSINCPADAVVACAADIVINPNDATGSASCDLMTTTNVTGPVINGSPNCPNTTYTYTYTVTDQTGRTASCDQVFTIQNDGPTITCPTDATIECFSAIIVDANNASTTTSCGLGSTVTLTGPAILGDADCPNTTYTYTYTVTDDCGRTAACQQVFTIANDGPTISCPANQTVECFEDIVVANTNATAVTSCTLGSTIALTGPVISGDEDCPNTTYTYTYTVTDDCGRTASCSQVFTIQNAGPTITCPAGATVTCFANISVDAANAITTTSCSLGSTVELTGPVISGDSDCPNTTYTYTYTVTDDCSRTASCQQVFTIQNDGPTITCPANATVECFSDIIVNEANAMTTSSCTLGSSVALTGPIISGDADCPNTAYTYTYIVTDDCGRTASCQQVFTIVNNGPTITCPADAIVECFADISVASSNAMTSSSCGLGSSVALTGPVISGNADCSITTYTYTYTVTDDCDRTASCQQVFTIQNNGPTITCPANTTVECFADIIVDAGNALTTSSCTLGSSIDLTGPEINGDDDCPNTTYTYTYIVTDDCGRTASCQQIFTIQNDAPTITCPADATVECFTDINVSVNNASITTSCTLGSTVALTGPVISGDGDCLNTTYTYIYTVTDICGRSASCQQVYTIVNNGPTVSCPADAVVECFSDINVAATNAVTTSSCSLGTNVILTGPIISGNPDCPNTSYTYTYTVTDDCGRTAICQQVFTIQNNAPTISCPADAIVGCFDDINVAAANAVTTSSCSLGTTVALSGPVISGDADCPNTTYTYTYTVTDDCGRTATCQQEFTIQNNAPTISCPPDATVQCFADISVSTNNAITNSSCSLSTNVSITGPVISGAPDCLNTTYTYTYTISDDCGRSASCQQVFTIANNGPTITCPADATVQCFADISVSAINANTTVSCGLTSFVSVTDPQIPAVANCPTTTFTYIYTVTDECGRTASCSQTFTIENDAPTITCPSDQTVSCEADISASNPGFTVSCGLNSNMDISAVTLISGLPEADGSIYTITYTVTDDCNRSASCTQSFTIANSGPSLTCPADVTVACFADIVVDAANATVGYSCGLTGSVALTGPVQSGDDNCPNTTYTYTYTVTDNTGRINSCQQVFTIANPTPTITCPPNQTVSCFADIVVNANNASTTTSCGLGSSILLSGPTMSGLDNCQGTTYSYVYMVTDVCGRTASCTQVFTISNAGPTITCPADFTIDCASNISLLESNAITTTSCGLTSSVAISAPAVSGDTDCPGTTLSYTYTVTDACGRTATCLQVVTIQNDPPIIICPANDVVECEADIEVDAFDANIVYSCGLTGIRTLTGPVINGQINCPGTTYSYTYFATDQCGRVSSCEQVFTISNPGPTITCPSDMTVGCVEEVIPGNPGFTTSCGLEESISVSSPNLISGQPNANGSVYHLIYTLTDECGRTVSCTQVFTIDNQGPMITCPADQTVECASNIIVDVNNGIVSSACGVAFSVSLSGPAIVGTPDCDGTTYSYTYTVTNVNGASNSCTQVFTISNGGPQIICPADDIVLCAADIVVGTPIVVTSCGVGAMSPSFTGPTLLPGFFPNENGAKYEIIYSVTDICGRTSSCTQTFTLSNSGPSITCPADITIDCIGNFMPGIPTTTTSCGLTSTLSPVSIALQSGLDDCIGSTYHAIYVVTDQVGRVASCAQVITIENDPPTISCIPGTMVTCPADIVLNISDATVMTSCTLGSTVTINPVAEESGPLDCPGTTLTYTYTVTDVCGRTATCQRTFEISPPLVAANQNMTVCSDVALDGFDIKLETGSATYFELISVTADNAGLQPMLGSSDFLNNLPPGLILQNGLYSEAYKNDLGFPINVTYVVRAISPNGCFGKEIEINSTIFSQPVVNGMLAYTVCSQEQTGVMLMGETSTTLGEIEIKSIDPEPGLIGTNLDNLNDPTLLADVIANDSWENTTGATLNVLYTVIPRSAQTMCLGEEVMIMLSVLSQPMGINAEGFEVCSGDPINLDLQQFLDAGNGMTGQSFTWKATGDNPNLLGDSLTLQNGPIIDDAIINTSLTGTFSVEYEVTPTSIDGCVGFPFSIKVNILKQPQGGMTGSTMVCNARDSEVVLFDVLQGMPDPVGTWTELTTGITPTGTTFVEGDYLASVDFSNLAVGTYTFGFNASTEKCSAIPILVHVEVTSCFDLAMTKILIDPADELMPVNPFDTITFELEVFNQTTNIDAYDVELTDYVPVGFLFDPAWNTNTLTGNLNNWNADMTYVISTIAPGASEKIKLRLVVDPVGLQGGLSYLDNEAEISFATAFDDSGVGTSDEDGVFDNINDDRKDGTAEDDDNIDDDALDDPNDEDDYDFEPVLLCPSITPPQFQYSDFYFCLGSGGTFEITPLEGTTPTGFEYYFYDSNPVLPGANLVAGPVQSYTADPSLGDPYVLWVRILDPASGCYSLAIPIEFYFLDGNDGIACNDRINLSLDSNCEAVITPSMVLEGIEPHIFLVCVYDQFGNAIGNTVGTEHVGQLLKYEVKDTCNGNSCWGSVFVEAKFTPVGPSDSDYTTNYSCEVGDILESYVHLVPNLKDLRLGSILDNTHDDIFIDPEWYGSAVGGPGYFDPAPGADISSTGYHGDTLSFTVPEVNCASAAVSLIFDHDFKLGSFDYQDLIVTSIGGALLYLDDDGLPMATPSSLLPGASYTVLVHALDNDAVGSYSLKLHIQETGCINQLPVNRELVCGEQPDTAGWVSYLEFTKYMNDNYSCLDFDILPPNETTCGNVCEDGEEITIVKYEILLRRAHGESQVLELLRQGYKTVKDIADIWYPVGPVEIPCNQSTTPEGIFAYYKSKYEFLGYAPYAAELLAIPYAYPHIYRGEKLVEIKTPITIDGHQVVEHGETEQIIWQDLDGDGVQDIDEWKVATILDKEIIFVEIDTFETSQEEIPIYIALDDKYCNVSAHFEDYTVEECGGGSKILREWSLYEWCDASEVQEKATQQIRQIDRTPPILLLEQEEIYVSIRPWSCDVYFEIPAPEKIEDECDTDVSLSYSVWGVGEVADGYFTGAIPMDTFSIISYIVEDECGNRTRKELKVYPTDEVRPVPVCNDQLIVSLTPDLFDGIAKVYAADLDAGSHDAGCGEIVKREIIRFEDLGTAGVSCHPLLKIDTIDGGADKFGNTLPDSFATRAIFGDFVKFCCEDGGKENLRVILRVWDAHGNYNDCMAAIEVQNKIIPTVECPEDVTLTCLEYDSETLYGIPSITSLACGVIDLTWNDYTALNSCYVGQVQRVFFEGTDIECTQIITVDDNEVFNPASIKWPAHYIDETYAEGLEKAINPATGLVEYIPATDPIPMLGYQNCGEELMACEPVWSDVNCGLVGLSYEDEIVTIDGEACTKIIRSWTVIDWCTWNPNGTQLDDENDTSEETYQPVWDETQTEECPGQVYFIYHDFTKDGYYTFDQIIKVIDKNPPIIYSNENQELTFPLAENCEGVIEFEVNSREDGTCLSELIFWEVYLDDAIVMDKISSLGNPLKYVSDELPEGVYSYTILAKDACNNFSEAFVIEATLRDLKPPTPFCITNVSTAVIGDEAGVTIWASDFISKAEDLCTAEEDLVYLFDDGLSSRTYTCADLDGNNFNIIDLNVQTVDLSGNATVCFVQLRLQNGVNNPCDLSSNAYAAIIAGNITTTQGEKVSDAMVSIMSDVPAYPQNMMTANDGVFAFYENLMGYDYELTANKTGDWSNGVSTLDVVKIQRHLLGLESLTNPYDIIAADVNNDFRISGVDLIELRQLVLGLDTKFKYNESWRFVDAKQSFMNDNSPFPFIEEINTGLLEHDMMDQDFIGVKIGDVNGSATANNLHQPEVRSNSTLKLSASDQYVYAGDIIEMKVSADNFIDVSGFQTTMDIEGLEFLSIQSDALDIADENIGDFGSFISVSWNSDEILSSDSPLFSIYFRAEINTLISDVISLNNRITPTEAYMGEQFEIIDMNLLFEAPELTSNTIQHLEVFQNEPNPFSKESIIWYVMPETSTATIRIDDLNGKLIRTWDIEAKRGYNQLTIRASDLNTSGMLFYTISNGKESVTKKMLLLK